MQFLIQKYGEEKIKSLLSLNKDEVFENSFKSVLGDPFDAVGTKIISYISKF